MRLHCKSRKGTNIALNHCENIQFCKNRLILHKQQIMVPLCDQSLSQSSNRDVSEKMEYKSVLITFMEMSNQKLLKLN